MLKLIWGKIIWNSYKIPIDNFIVSKKLETVLIIILVSKYQISRNPLGLGRTQAMWVHPQKTVPSSALYLISSVHLCSVTIWAHTSLLWVFWKEIWLFPGVWGYLKLPTWPHMKIDGVGKRTPKEMLGTRKNIMADPWPLLQLWHVGISKHQWRSWTVEDASVRH